MHLVGIIIRIYHDARSSECQKSNCVFQCQNTIYRPQILTATTITNGKTNFAVYVVLLCKLFDMKFKISK